MHTPDPSNATKPSSVLSFRVSREAKAALNRRAKLRTKAEARTVSPSEVARDLLEYALQETEETGDAISFDDLIAEVLASTLFSRRALELVLSEHKGLAEKLFRACRAEVTRRTRGRRLWRMT